MDRLLLLVGCLLSTIHCLNGEPAVFDCSDIDRNLNSVLEISEIEQIGHVVAEYRNTSGIVGWRTSYDGQRKVYLESFFGQVKGQGQSNTSSQLFLKKVLDLEYLHLAFPPLQQMSREDINNVTFQLNVTCSLHDRTSRTHTLEVRVLSVNEFYPQFTGAPFSVKVPESLEVGATLIDLSNKAVDMDVGQSTLTFNLSPYIISEFDGRRFVRADETDEGQIRLTTPLDFESFKVKGRTYFFLNVTVSDDGGFTSVTTVNVTVTDADDQSIQFLYPECNKPCQDVSYTVYTNESYVGILAVLPVDVSAEDLDTLNDSIIYTLVSPDSDFFDIDSETGVLYKTNPLVNDSYSYNISLTVTYISRCLHQMYTI